MSSNTSASHSKSQSSSSRYEVRDDSFLSFFRYHGIWSPGVRLFRRLNFQAKASIVSVAFLVPLLVLAWSFNTSKQAELDFVVAERAGVAYAVPLTQVTTAMLRERQLQVAKAKGEASPELTAVLGATDTAWRTLEAQQTLHAELLQSQSPFQQARDALQRARGMAGATPDQIYATYSDAIATQAALLEWAVDKSNLALDPEFASYYLMDASMIAGPDLALSSERLHAGLVNAIAAGTLDTQGLMALDRERQTVMRRVAQFEASMGKAAQNLPDLLKRVPLDDVKNAVAGFLAIADPIMQGGPLPTSPREVALAGARTAQVADAVIQKGLPALDDMLSQREHNLRETRALVNGLSTLCVALAGYLLYCFYRVTRGGMEEVRHHLSAMTNGDLSTHPRPWGRDEAASLMNSLAEMQQSLRAVVTNVREAADTIVHSSAEIAGGSTDLSARTERTASNLQESAASMDEIAATVKQTAEHAVEAAKLASGNADVAMRGGEVIGNVVNTMQEIRQSSHKISDITAVIDGIAFQTNILALNAAVEAARAGEQGRGFAVVASEVRALAQRSASAAREIKLLIQDSVGRVESGTEVVRQAGQTMDDIVHSAQQMNGLLSEIATGAREQSMGVAQVGQAVQDLDRVAQGNAALVEQTAAASESLKHQAHTLAQAVSAFKLAT